MEEIAIQFINPINQDDAFFLTLEKLLEISGADRAVIMQINPDNSDLVSITHERCRKGTRSVQKYAQNIPRAENPWFQKMHRKYGYVAVSDTSQMPEEAENERKMYERYHIGSSLMASFASKNEFRGNLHLENKKPIKEWHPEVIRMIIFVSVLIEHSIERIEAETKLRSEKERAEQSDRMKSAFMANLSHEIRTPLNGLLGFTKLLTQHSSNDDKRSHYAELMEKSSVHLMSIIDDLIDLSRIESGSINIIRNPVNLHELIRGSYESFMPEIQENNKIRLKLELPANDRDLLITTDSRRLRQIIDNLMKNAIRYTPEGSITMGYKRVGKKKLHIYVQDTGIGIGRENLSKVFNRFWQVEHDQARTYGGSGLGLSISKDFASMLGGDIIVKSKKGKGSLFTIILPL